MSNKIITQVEKIMREELAAKLPDVRMSDLEDEGAIFYMNGKNGTAFDWYVNEHFPCFFMFYNDKENLGAVKATLYDDGYLTTYVYGDKGHADPVDETQKIEAEESELLELAVILTNNADCKKIWDSDIRKIDTDTKPDIEAVGSFKELKAAHEPMIERRDLISKTAIVSKKVREEGFKIGYGIRMEPTNERDSGWCFSVGNESEEYINDPQNLELWLINSVLMFDPDLNEFIASPYDTAIVRVASDKFEPDSPGKEILIEKRKNE